VFLLCAFFFLAFGFFGVSGFAETVRHVVDGDTLVLEDGVTVRLIGIDAPEVDHPRYGKIGEPFGPESAKFLQDLIEGKTVRLEAGDEPEDRYHRRLAYVYREADNLFVNRRMVEAGYAETYRRFDFKYKKEFLKLEAKARQQRVGMWTESPDSWNQQFLHWMSMRQPRRKTALVSPDQ